jgi:hypothetical protein
MRAWGEHYATRSLAEAEDLAVFQVSRPARGCLSYLVASAGEAIVIDPLRHVQPYLGSGALGRRRESDRPWTSRPRGSHQRRARSRRKNGSFVPPASVRRHSSARRPSGNHPLRAVCAREKSCASAATELEALHIPGHTLGLVALRLQDRFCSPETASSSAPSRGRISAAAPRHGRPSTPGRCDGCSSFPAHHGSSGALQQPGRGR